MLQLQSYTHDIPIFDREEFVSRVFSDSTFLKELSQGVSGHAGSENSNFFSIPFRHPTLLRVKISGENDFPKLLFKA